MKYIITLMLVVVSFSGIQAQHVAFNPKRAYDSLLNRKMHALQQQYIAIGVKSGIALLSCSQFDTMFIHHDKVIRGYTDTRCNATSLAKPASIAAIKETFGTRSLNAGYAMNIVHNLVISQVLPKDSLTSIFIVHGYRSDKLYAIFVSYDASTGFTTFGVGFDQAIEFCLQSIKNNVLKEEDLFFPVGTRVFVL